MYPNDIPKNLLENVSWDKKLLVTATFFQAEANPGHQIGPQLAQLGWKNWQHRQTLRTPSGQCCWKIYVYRWTYWWMELRIMDLNMRICVYITDYITYYIDIYIWLYMYVWTLHVNDVWYPFRSYSRHMVELVCLQCSETVFGCERCHTGQVAWKAGEMPLCLCSSLVTRGWSAYSIWVATKYWYQSSATKYLIWFMLGKL